MIDSSVLTKLCTFDTPTICNLIELFDIRPRSTGFMDERIRACFPEMAPTVGFAATATFRASAPPLSGDLYSQLSQQVERFGELPGPAVVVFQDLDSPPVGATFGEIMCTTYKTFGAAGLITSGAGRDLEQVHRLGFPVFTNGAICAHGYCHIPQIHVPVHVGGIAIYPGDLIHADCNGVTTIPVEIAAEVAGAGDEFIAAETVVLNTLREQGASPAHFQAAQAESKAMVATLKTRLVRKR